MDHNGAEAAVVKREVFKESSLIKEELDNDHEGDFDGCSSEQGYLEAEPLVIKNDDLDHKLGTFPGEAIRRTSESSDLGQTAGDEGTEGQLAVLNVEDQGQQRTADPAVSAQNGAVSHSHRCDLCGLTFPSVDTLQRHLSTHSKTLSVSPQDTDSDDCDFDFNEECKDAESLSESEVVESDRVTRSSNNAKRRFHDNVQSSKRKKQKRSPAPARSVAVGETSVSSTHHEQSPVESTDTDAKSDDDDDDDSDGNDADDIRAHRCTICGKRYKYDKGLKVHLRTHSASETHKCDVCSNVYARRDVMLRHRREVHFKDKLKTGKEKPNFACDMCDKGFAAPDQLRKHKRHHIENRPFKCDVCDRAFLLKGDLTKHYLSHSQERPYKCKVCKRGFARNTTLKKHLRRHTGERPYSCDACGTTFARQDILAVHKRSHTGETPYKCATCGASFSQKSSLLWHVKTCK